MMNKWLKSILCIGFCLMFCFLTVGYASLNDQLYVSGSVSYVPEETKPPKVQVGTFEIKNVGSFPIYKNGNKYEVTFTLPSSSSNKTYENRFRVTDTNLNIDSDEYLQLDNTSENGNSGGSIDQGSSYKGFIKTKEGGTYTIQFSFSYSWNKEEYDGSWSVVSHTTASAASYSLDTTNIQNLSIESSEATTFDLEFRPNLLLTLTPDEGYLLPESFIVTIGDVVYTIHTNGENELETMLFDTETGTLYIFGNILPTDGSAVVITAYAVPEVPPYTVDIAGTSHMQVGWYTADSGLYFTLTPEDGYLIPESFTVTIGETACSVYTTAEDAAEEGQPSVKDNPPGMGYDTIAEKLFISDALLPTDGSAVVITATAVFLEEESEETEPPEEPTEASTEDPA